MSIHLGFVQSIWLIGILLFLFTTPSASSKEPARRAPSRIVFCGNYAYPPYSMIDSKGRPSGFSVELIKAIGREVDLELEIRMLPWKEVREAMETERSADVATMFYSEERDRIFDFGVPLASVVHEIFVRQNGAGIDSLEKLNGKQVLVEERSYAAEYLLKYHPEIHIVPVDSEPTALRLLSSGKADAAIASQPGGFYCIAQYGLKNIVPADFPVLPINYSFVTLDGRPELMREINRGLARVRRSGEYAKLYSRWFGVHPPGIPTGIPWRYMAIAGASLLLVAGTTLFWIWSLRRQVSEKTHRLRNELAERERVERSLRESEARLQTILDHSTAVIFLKDLEGRYSVVNRVFTEVTGKETSEIIGRSDWELFPPKTALTFTENDRKVLEAGIPMTFEETSDYEGRARTFLNVKFPIRDSAGVIQALGGVSTDITDRKQFEQEVQAAREVAEGANRAKDHFLAVLSHELRTPLTPVLAAVTEALDSDLPAELRSILEMIQRNIELESRLIEDLLDLTRLARGKLKLNFRTSDAHELLRDATAICAPTLAAKKQQVRFELNASHPYVRADPARLQQVFWNLLHNSIKFSPPGSEIILRSFNREDGQVVVQCIDPGMGLERDVLERIFRPFEQVESSMSRHYGGLGLGLAISRMIIDAHRGEISADSAGPGKGSVFTVTLPCARKPAPEIAPRPPKTPDGGTGGLHILLVEDSDDTRQILAKILRSRGHEVETAGSAAAARDLWHHRRFDLLLSDIGLPDASGLDLATELRREGPLRAIAFSGFGSEEDIRRSKAAGFAEHLVKPLDIGQLKQALTRVMSREPTKVG